MGEQGVQSLLEKTSAGQAQHVDIVLMRRESDWSALGARPRRQGQSGNHLSRVTRRLLGVSLCATPCHTRQALFHAASSATAPGE